MLQGQQVLTDLALPILEDFLRNTADRGEPRTPDLPTLPESMSGHGLYVPLKAAVARVFAMTELGPKLFKDDRQIVVQPIAILQLANADFCGTFVRRIEAFGCEPPARKIKLAATAIAEQVERATMPADDWARDYRGEVENDNPDNLAVFLAIIGCDLRWNDMDRAHQKFERQRSRIDVC